MLVDPIVDKDCEVDNTSVNLKPLSILHAKTPADAAILAFVGIAWTWIKLRSAKPQSGLAIPWYPPTAVALTSQYHLPVWGIVLLKPILGYPDPEA